MIYPLHVRWLAVWKRVFGGKTWRTIGRHLSEASIGQKGPTKSTMKRWVKRYKLYGDVADDARKKGGNLLFTRRRDRSSRSWPTRQATCSSRSAASSSDAPGYALLSAQSARRCIASAGVASRSALCL